MTIIGQPPQRLTDPMLAVVREAGGTFTELSSQSIWLSGAGWAGDGDFADIQSIGNGRFMAAGTVKHREGFAGTWSFRARLMFDRIFADGMQ